MWAIVGFFLIFQEKLEICNYLPEFFQFSTHYESVCLQGGSQGCADSSVSPDKKCASFCLK